MIPLLLLFIFGYGINLDSSKLRVGILLEQRSEAALDFTHTMTGSPYIDATISDNRQELIAKMQAGKIRGLVVIPVDFAEQMERANATAPIQVITDGSEPNTANFVQGYVEGIWQIWQMQRAEDNGQTFEPLIDVQTRYWFNPAAISQALHYPRCGDHYHDGHRRDSHLAGGGARMGTRHHGGSALYGDYPHGTAAV